MSCCDRSNLGNTLVLEPSKISSFILAAGGSYRVEGLTIYLIYEAMYMTKLPLNIGVFSGGVLVKLVLAVMV